MAVQSTVSAGIFEVARLPAHRMHWYTLVVSVSMSFSRHLAWTRAAMLLGIAAPDNEGV